MVRSVLIPVFALKMISIPPRNFEKVSWLNGWPLRKIDMGIHILLAGEQIGPFSETQVRRYLGEGLVSPSDLATYEGMEDWQALDLILANLPPSATPPETISPDAPPPESPAPEEQAPKPEPPFTMHNDTSETIELASAPPPAEPVPPLTASQKTKRKLGKIVIQPILPLEATVPAKKKPRTGKTALTLEPLRPTTALPPVTGFTPIEMKPTKTLIRPGQLSLRDFSEKPVATPTATPPAAPVTPPVPSNGSQPPPPPLSTPPGNAMESSAARPWARRIPREIIYATAGLAFIFVCLIFSGIYLISEHHETPPAANPENAPPPPNPVGMQNTQTGSKAAADYITQGLAQQAKGDLDGAILDYNQALGLDPKQADAFSNRGFAKQSQGDFEGALADYAQALLINPKIPAAYYNQGLIEVQKGYLDSAIADYNHALDLDPKMALAYYNRGIAKNMEGNLDGAIADYTQALILNPKIALAYYKRGFARQSKGDPDGALADYSQALALDPKMADAFYNRGLIKLQKGDLDGAIDDNTQAIGLDPKNGQAYCNRGLARVGKSDLNGAMADLRTFCELAPRDNDADTARIYLWLISTEMNPQGNADQELSTSLLNDWNSPPEDLSSKIAAFLLGHINESDLIANAASPDPSREPGQYCKVWYFAGMKRLLAGDMTIAISYFQKSLATKQNDLCECIFARAELQALGQNRAIPSKPGSNP
jgi:tetratricopeptide (TPR) repeat protein